MYQEELAQVIAGLECQRDRLLEAGEDTGIIEPLLERAQVLAQAPEEAIEHLSKFAHALFADAL